MLIGSRKLEDVKGKDGEKVKEEDGINYDHSRLLWWLIHVLFALQLKFLQMKHLSVK